MPTQLQLEGPELEPLLDRVRLELGPGVRILQAEKVRVGGIGGFFARQRYELTVEVDDVAPVTAAPAPSPAAVRTGSPAAGPTGTRAGDHDGVVTGPGAAARGTVTDGGLRAEAPAPASLLDLVDQVSRQEEAVISTQSPTFASLLSRLGSTIGAAPDVQVAPEDDSPAGGRAAAGPADSSGVPTAQTSAGATPAGATGHPGGPPGAALSAACSSPASGATPEAPAQPFHAPERLAASPDPTRPAGAGGEDTGPSTGPSTAVASLPARTADSGTAVSGTDPLPAQHGASQELVPQERTAHEPVLPEQSRGLSVPDPTSRELAVPELSARALAVPDRTAQELAVPGPPARDLAAPDPTPRELTAASAQPGAAAHETSGAPPIQVGTEVELASAELASVELASVELASVELASMELAPVEPADAVTGPVPAPPLAEPLGGLARLGLPAHLLPADDGADLYSALVTNLRKLPKVPRTTNRAGGVLAVVGPLSLALDVSQEVALELGLPVSTSVFLAASTRAGNGVPERQRVRDATSASARRAGWRRRRGLTVVAVDADLTAAGASQARVFLAALEPTATWGVVEATRKAHDVGAWTRALGGVHALALTGIEETADPAAVLELGIPVSRLGGRPATPAVWASLLTGRLAA